MALFVKLGLFTPEDKCEWALNEKCTTMDKMD